MNADPLRIGLIGAGHIARAQAAIWQNEATLVAVASRQRPKAEALARSFQVECVFDTPDELIASDRVDAISIATPPHLHYPFAMQAIRARKNVFCEKPLAVNAEQAREMWACGQQHGVATGIQSGIRTSFPGLWHLKNIIDSHELGELLYFEGIWAFDWARQPDFPMGWRFRRDLAGTGALGDLGVYLIDAARWLIGEIQSVAADFQTIIAERPVISDLYDFSEVRGMIRDSRLPASTGPARVENEDACSLLVRFTNGATGTIRASRIGRRNTILVEGTEAAFQWDLQTGVLGRRGAGEVAYTPVPLPDGFPNRSIVTQFIENIRNVTNHPPTFWDGFRAQQVIDAAVQAVQTRRWIDISDGSE